MEAILMSIGSVLISALLKALIGLIPTEDLPDWLATIIGLLG